MKILLLSIVLVMSPSPSFAWTFFRASRGATQILTIGDRRFSLIDGQVYFADPRWRAAERLPHFSKSKIQKLFDFQGMLFALDLKGRLHFWHQDDESVWKEGLLPVTAEPLAFDSHVWQNYLNHSDERFLPIRDALVSGNSIIALAENGILFRLDATTSELKPRTLSGTLVTGRYGTLVKIQALKEAFVRTNYQNIKSIGIGLTADDREFIAVTDNDRRTRLLMLGLCDGFLSVQPESLTPL